MIAECTFIKFYSESVEVMKLTIFIANLENAISSVFSVAPFTVALRLLPIL